MLYKHSCDFFATRIPKKKKNKNIFFFQNKRIDEVAWHLFLYEIHCYLCFLWQNQYLFDIPFFAIKYEYTREFSNMKSDDIADWSQ